MIEIPIGARVRICALKQVGSCFLLDGLTGIVLRPHHIAEGWVFVRLDPNEVTAHLEWPVPADRLLMLPMLIKGNLSRA